MAAHRWADRRLGHDDHEGVRRRPSRGGYRWSSHRCRSAVDRVDCVRRSHESLFSGAISMRPSSCSASGRWATGPRGAVRRLLPCSTALGRSPSAVDCASAFTRSCDFALMRHCSSRPLPDVSLPLTSARSSEVVAVASSLRSQSVGLARRQHPHTRCAETRCAIAMHRLPSRLY